MRFTKDKDDENHFMHRIFEIGDSLSRYDSLGGKSAGCKSAKENGRGRVA
jgi:hypothetical protein